MRLGGRSTAPPAAYGCTLAFVENVEEAEPWDGACGIDGGEGTFNIELPWRDHLELRFVLVLERSTFRPASPVEARVETD